MRGQSEYQGLKSPKRRYGVKAAEDVKSSQGVVRYNERSERVSIVAMAYESAAHDLPGRSPKQLELDWKTRRSGIPKDVPR